MMTGCNACGQPRRRTALPLRLAFAAILILLSAGCDRHGGADAQNGGPSAKEKARIAADATQFEEKLRIANLEKRVDLLEAQLAVGPKTRDHLELDLIKARLDKVEMDAMMASEMAKQQAAIAAKNAKTQ